MVANKNVLLAYQKDFIHLVVVVVNVAECGQSYQTHGEKQLLRDQNNGKSNQIVAKFVKQQLISNILIAL